MEVGRNSIILRNIANKEEFKTIRNRFSIYNKVTHKYENAIYYTIGNDIYLPASIGANVINNLFPKEEIIYIKNHKGREISFNMKSQPRDELQVESIKFILGMKNDKKSKDRLLALRPGKGKTFIAIHVISKLKRVPFVIVDTIALAEQWKEKFLEHTDLKAEDIVILSGQDSVEKELRDISGKIYIALHKTLGAMIANDPNSMNKLMKKLGVGIRVFDECHVDFVNECNINSLSNVDYTLYLSATPGRSNFRDNTLFSKVFQNIKFFDGAFLESENKNYHTVILYKFNSEPSLEEKLSIRTKYGFSLGKWAENITNNCYEKFIDSLFNLFEKLSLETRKKKVAIMLPTIELIKKVQQSLSEKYNNSEDIGLFIGEIKKKKEREEALQKRIIITNDKIFDKAIDVPDLEILINYVQMSSKIKTEQIMGRLRYGANKSSILIDVTDFGYLDCLNQLKLRKRLYKKKAKKIIELK